LPFDPLTRDFVPTNPSLSTQRAPKYRPISQDGKRRSRQIAVRHGLSAETVVEIVEDIDDCRGFEAAIFAD
jgi:hypothetical protein